MNDFTKGNARVVDDGLHTVCIGTLKICHFTPFDLSGMCKTDEENAKLTAVAFTTATKLVEQGYDAVKALELLPELVRVIQDLPSDELIGEAVREALDQCRGEV